MSITSRLIRDGVAKAPGPRWLELGAGDGTFTLALAEVLGASASIVAMDRDRDALGRLSGDWPAISRGRRRDAHGRLHVGAARPARSTASSRRTVSTSCATPVPCSRRSGRSSCLKAAWCSWSTTRSAATSGCRTPSRSPAGRCSRRPPASRRRSACTASTAGSSTRSTGRRRRHRRRRRDPPPRADASRAGTPTRHPPSLEQPSGSAHQAGRPPTIVATTVMARISSGVPLGDVAAQDRDVTQRARRKVAAAGLVPQGPGRVHGHRAQPLLGGQQLVVHPRRSPGHARPRPSIPPATWSTGRPHVIGQREVREEPGHVGRRRRHAARRP